MSKPARRRTTTKTRKKKITPEEIRAFIEKMYDARTVEWSLELFDSGAEIDWEYLLGLHLQMCELEHLRERIEELPL
jgi:hypothetical protein